MKQIFLHYLTQIFFIFYELIPLNLLNTKFSSHNFFPEPEIALTKELVGNDNEIMGFYFHHERVPKI